MLLYAARAVVRRLLSPYWTTQRLMNSDPVGYGHAAHRTESDRPGSLDDLSLASHTECQHFSFEIPTGQTVPSLTTEIARRFVTDQIPRIATMANSPTDPADKAAAEATTANSPTDPADKAAAEAAAARAQRQADYGDISDEDYSMILYGVPVAAGIMPSSVPLRCYTKKASTTKNIYVVPKSAEGLPIEITPPKIFARREVLEEGHSFGFNEPGNVFAVNLTIKLVMAMCDKQKEREEKQRKAGKTINLGGPLAQNGPFMKLYWEEINSHSEKLQLDEPISNVDRINRCVWKLWRYFDPKYEINHGFQQILLEYVNIRLGHNKKDADEYEAMVWACNEYFSRDRQINSVHYAEYWTVPLIHAINWHIRVRLPRWRPLIFSMNAEGQEVLKKARAKTSKWIELPAVPQKRKRGKSKKGAAKKDESEEKAPKGYKVAVLPLDIKNFELFLTENAAEVPEVAVEQEVVADDSHEDDDLDKKPAAKPDDPSPDVQVGEV